jgi:signal transduction histidine kinase
MTSFTGIPSNIAIYTSAADIFINENAIVVTVINSALSGEEYLYKRISLNTEHGSRKVVLNAMPRYSDNQIDIEGTACVLWDVTLLTEKEINDLIALDNRYREDFNSISRDMQKLAEELEMKGNFVRSVSHEIRTPLNVVMAGLQLIETQFKNEISPEVLALIEEIEQSCRDGVNILDDLLAYEKIEGRVLAVERQPISVTQLVKTCIHPFQMQARLTNVNMIYSESLNVGNMTTICQDFIIFVDKFKTMQVVRNLISNAIKFTRDGKVECRVSWTEKSVEPLLENNNKGFVRIEVIDNGIGLSEVSRLISEC